MATIARLVTVIEAQTKGFEVAATQFEKMGREMTSVASMATTAGKVMAGAFSAGVIVNAAKEVASFASDMQDMSLQTGIGVERLQALNYVSAGAGVTIEELANGVGQLSKRLIEGDDGAVGALERLRLNVNSLIAMAPDRAFIEIAEAVSKIPNPMERSALMMELFGRNGTKFLRLATADLEGLVTAAEHSGAVIDEQLLHKVAEFDDMWAQGEIRLKAMAVGLADFAATATKVASPTRAMVESFREFQAVVSGTTNSAGLLESTVNPLANTAIPKLGLSMREMEKIAADLDKQIGQKLAKAHEAAARATQQQAEAYARLMSEVRNAEGLAQMEAEANRLRIAWENGTIALEMMTKQVHLLNQPITELAMSGPAAIQSLNSSIGGTVDQMIDAYTKSVEWQQAMDDLGNSFLTFAQIAGDSMGTVLRQIGAAIAGVRLASDGVSALKSGFSALGGGNILKGLTGIVGGIGGIASAASAAIQVVTSLWHGLQRLFGGGEEGTIVNPARDAFFQQFVDRYGLSPFESMAQAFADAGVSGDVAERMIRTLYDAETMAAFKPAAQAIIDAVGSLGFGMNFHRGGMVPGSGEVQATLLGGERVQSREEVADMRVLAREIRELPQRFAVQVVSAMSTHGRFKIA